VLKNVKRSILSRWTFLIIIFWWRIGEIERNLTNKIIILKIYQGYNINYGKIY